MIDINENLTAAPPILDYDNNDYAGCITEISDIVLVDEYDRAPI